jgi:hypothetical protein
MAGIWGMPAHAPQLVLDQQLCFALYGAKRNN